MTLEILKLSTTDACELSELLLNEPEDYVNYFNPFGFDLITISEILQNNISDIYMSIRCNNAIVGFYMLRGLDEGYATPAFGLFISAKYSNLGLGHLALAHAISQCKILNIKQIMLHVTPGNFFAIKLYEKNGFFLDSEGSTSNKLRYFKNL